LAALYALRLSNNILLVGLHQSFLFLLAIEAQKRILSLKQLAAKKQ